MSRTWLRGSTRPEWGHLRARLRPPSPPPPPLPPLLQARSSGLLHRPQPPGADARHRGDVLGCFGVGVFVLEAEFGKVPASTRSNNTVTVLPLPFWRHFASARLAVSISSFPWFPPLCLVLSSPSLQCSSFLFVPCSSVDFIIIWTNTARSKFASCLWVKGKPTSSRQSFSWNAPPFYCAMKLNWLFVTANQDKEHPKLVVMCTTPVIVVCASVSLCICLFKSCFLVSFIWKWLFFL